jgi:hypothetical protein
LIDINLSDIRPVLEASLVWLVWVIKNLTLYLLILFLGGLFGLYFEQDNIAQLEAYAAWLEAAQENKRSSYVQHKSI